MRRVFIHLVVAMMLASPALAETILLKDGSRMTGTILGADADSVRFQTPDGVLTIRRERIQSIDYGTEPPAPRSTSPPATSPPAATSPPRDKVGRDLAIVGAGMMALGGVLYLARGSKHYNVQIGPQVYEYSVKRKTSVATYMLVGGGAGTFIVGLALLGNKPDSSHAALRLVPAPSGIALAYRF